MHNNIFFASTIIAVATISCANAKTNHAYANAISTHNINTIQRTIANMTFDEFRAKSTVVKRKKSPTAPNASIYGKMPTYGEYNDDGSMGRSGGDTTHNATLNNIWLSGHHIDDKIKFDEHTPIDTETDIVAAGIASNQHQIGSAFHNWGLYTGYISGDQENSSIKTDNQGGFFGIYNGVFTDRAYLATSVTGGVLDNATDFEYGTDSFSNFWLNGTIQASYDFKLDDTFIIRPALSTSYTWIKSNDYTSVSDEKISNDAFRFFEISPEINMIKHIGGGWSGAINAKYIIAFTDGGDTYANSTKLLELDTGNFFEYGLSVEKQFEKTTISANLGRRDGFRYGWFGGLDIKYTF